MARVLDNKARVTDSSHGVITLRERERQTLVKTHTQEYVMTLLARSLRSARHKHNVHKITFTDTYVNPRDATRFAIRSVAILPQKKMPIRR